MFKDEETEGVYKPSLVRVPRDNVKRQSRKSGFLKPPIKRKSLKKWAVSESSDISDTIHKVIKDESMQNNHEGNKQVIGNDIKTTYTTVKAPIFKYSKCRTCRIPCSNGDIIEKGRQLKVNVKKISLSDCLKFKDLKVFNVGDETRKCVPLVENPLCNESRKCANSNGNHEKTKVDAKNDENTTGILSVGGNLSNTYIEPDNLHGNIKYHHNGVADRLINSGDEQYLTVSSSKIASAENGSKMLPEHTVHKQTKLIKTEELLQTNTNNSEINDDGCDDMTGISGHEAKRSVKLLNGSRNSKRRFSRLYNNKSINIKHINKDLTCNLSQNGCEVEPKQCIEKGTNFNSEIGNNHFKDIVNEGNIFAMVLRSRKCIINNDTEKIQSQNDIMEGIKIFNKGLQSHQMVANSDKTELIFDKENKSTINERKDCSSHHVDLNGSNNCSETGDHSLFDNSVGKIKNELLWHNISEKNVLPGTSNEGYTNCKNLFCPVTNNGLKHLSSNNANRKKSRDYMKNFDSFKINNTHDHHCNANEQICQCFIKLSNCLKCSVDVDLNLPLDHRKEHNLRHNRKHVRLKEKAEEAVNNYTGSFEINSTYVLESSRRLNFLHNFISHDSLVKPDDEIVHTLLEDIELDIEIIDEDRIFDDTPREINLTKKTTKESWSKCEWEDCFMQFPDSMSLLNHLKSSHINENLDRKFLVSCLWRNCKFSNQQCSYKWLSNHIMKHCSVRPFKCVILGCDLSFTTQSGLARHVPSHFNEGKIRRTCVTSDAGKDCIKSNELSNITKKCENTEVINEFPKKRTNFERFVECYKSKTCNLNKKDQSWINVLKSKLQQSSSNSVLNCGFVGRCFRIHHNVVGKRTSQDGSTEILLAPATKILPYKSFWFNEQSFMKHNSSFVDLSVNTLSEDVKQNLYDCKISRH